MIRLFLYVIFAISILTLIAGCKPARFVYVGSFAVNGVLQPGHWPSQISGFDINATNGVLTTITGSPWAVGQNYQISTAVIPSGQFLYATRI
jgi:hypothetical protein